MFAPKEKIIEDDTMIETDQFPNACGVYLMKNEEGVILYVGKAKTLRQRIKQYFIPGRDGRTMVPLLVKQVHSIETIVVSSEKEALVLENNLIKKHQPKYNVLLKDDKTYFGLAINQSHPWPMLKVARLKGKPPKGQLYFGPYTNAFAARRTLDVLRTLFPLRQCSDFELKSRTRPCILYDLKRCVAPCVNKCTHEEYDAYVQQVTDFLRGKEQTIVKDLLKKRDEASDKLDFEKAGRIHKTLQAIRLTLERQKVEQAGGKDLDVLALKREGLKMAITQLFFREGKLIGSHDHLVREVWSSDEEALTSFLLQHYDEGSERPKDGLYLPFTLKDLSILATLLGTKFFVPKRGEKKALIEMAEKNAMARLEREDDVEEKLLAQMERQFQLHQFPEVIECYDHSHLSGSEPVASRVVFVSGKKEPKLYRRYKIAHGKWSDDYGALREVLERRFGKKEALPDLMMIDGGKGHLNTALEVLKRLNITSVDVIGVAKEEGRHDKGSSLEQIFLPHKGHPLLLKARSPLLFFLQRVRDEAHRFAITYQKQRRSKKLVASELDTLAGIGPIKKKRLLLHFGSVKKLRSATQEQWSHVPGITKRDLKTLQHWKEETDKK